MMGAIQRRIIGRTLFLTTILLQAAVPGSGQQNQPRLIPVIALSKEEAAKARTLNEQIPQAQKTWDDLIWFIREKYTVIPGPTKVYPHTTFKFPDGIERDTLLGFSYSRVTFSPDFRFLVGGGSGGDPLTVIDLAKEDTDKARASYGHLIQAQKDWVAFQELIRQKYAVVPKSDKTTPSSEVVIEPGPKKHRAYRGLQFIHFTPDFRFIVGS